MYYSCLNLHALVFQCVFVCAAGRFVGVFTIVQIFPRNEGQVKVMVQDHCLPVSVVTATVDIGNIHSIQVKVADKVGSISSMLHLHVHVYVHAHVIVT